MESGSELDYSEDDGAPLRMDTSYNRQDNNQSFAGSSRMPATSSSNINNAQQFCLRWKYHHNNLQTVFSQLLDRQAYCDVTLASEGRTLRAHKVVLSACSTYFDAILSQYEGRDPVIIMRDVKFCDIKALIEFMYKGETNIEQARLPSLLKTAEDLHIKGLADVKSTPNETNGDAETLTAMPRVEAVLREGEFEGSPTPAKKRRGRPTLDESVASHETYPLKFPNLTGNNETNEDHQNNWDDEGMMSEGNENSLVIDTSYFGNENDHDRRGLLSSHSFTESSSLASNSMNLNNINSKILEQYRDVIRMSDYLTTGRRQDFWEEPFTKRVMNAIKSKEIELKAAAEILGVSYGTLYGRYRDSYGCLKHPYRPKDFWSEPTTCEILMKYNRKEITLSQAAESLNIPVQNLKAYFSSFEGLDKKGSLDTSLTNQSIESFSNANELLMDNSSDSTSSPAMIKREGGGFIEIPSLSSSSTRLEGPKQSENNDLKLMSGGIVSEHKSPQLQHNISNSQMNPLRIQPPPQQSSSMQSYQQKRTQMEH